MNLHSNLSSKLEKKDINKNIITTENVILIVLLSEKDLKINFRNRLETDISETYFIELKFIDYKPKFGLLAETILHSVYIIKNQFIIQNTYYFHYFNI